MKKMVLGVLAVAFLASCSKGGPETVATEYLNALKGKNWEKAESLATEETKAKISMLKTFGESGITEVKDVKCEVVGEDATCTFCCAKENETSKISLKKVDNKWVVNDPKEAPVAPEETEELDSTIEEAGDQIEAAANEVEAAVENATK